MKKTNTKTMVLVAGFSVFFFCIMFTCLILIISGMVNFSVSSFAVDNTDRLFIGAQKEIRIYEDGRTVNSISVPTSRSYVFTILEGNKILLSTSTQVYTMDLDGNILDTTEDSGADIYNQISYHKRKFVSENGDEYKLSNTLGRTRIIKNKTDVVYQIDALSFIVKILMAACFVAMLVFTVWIVSSQKSRL